MPRHKSRRAYFNATDRNILYGLIKDYIAFDKKVGKSNWIELTRIFNRKTCRNLASNQVINFWNHTKENFYKKIVANGLKIIFDLSPGELRVLNLIPRSYFSSLVKQSEFERCLNIASSQAKQTYVEGKESYESKFQESSEEDRQNASGSEYFTESNQSNDKLSSFEAMENENSDPLFIPNTLDTLSSKKGQECFDSSKLIEDKTIINLDDNFIYENSSAYTFSNDESCPSTPYFKPQIQKFDSTHELTNKSSDIVHYNNVVNKKPSELEIMIKRPIWDSPQNDLTMPCIVNVHRLTSEQFDECEQASDNLKEEELDPPVNSENVSSVNFDNVSSLNDFCNSFLNRSAKTTPNFPNAIFEFEDEAQDSLQLSDMTPPSIHTATSLVIPPVIPNYTRKDVLNANNFFKTKLNRKQTLFEFEMDELRKERKCIEKEHSSEMKSLIYEYNSLSCQFRDMIHAAQLRKAHNVIIEEY